MIANLVIILLTSAVTLAEVIVLCAGAQDVLPTTILPLLDVKVSNTVTTAAIFSRANSELYKKQAFKFDCGKLLGTVTNTGGTCSFMLDLLQCAGTKVKFVSYIDSDPTSQTTESYFTVSLTGTASTSLTTIQNEVATPKVVKMVQSPSAGNTLQIDLTVDLVNANIASNNYYREGAPILNDNYVVPLTTSNNLITLSGLKCGSGAVTIPFNIFSCPSSVSGSDIKSGGVCTTKNTQSLVVTPSGSTGSDCFTVSIVKTYVLKLLTENVIIGGDIQLQLGTNDINTPKLYVSKVTVSSGSATVELDATCFKDANGVANVGGLSVSGGDLMEFHLGSGAFPTSGTKFYASVIGGVAFVALAAVVGTVVYKRRRSSKKSEMESEQLVDEAAFVRA
ncbi:hypothetical protein BCR33DRAFT_859109 [Rhizoclosmatium globosum]|uniref:Mid2 domain-containing protein n=1 Tax=Rhizoclosmatium globosum TaxID=329046 RepID=A0A1Y2AV62_9FUNG|nr:hypothetical protein BCR33DRAFT_859109 [Rhizoclosmatium globosum]|eukprot:ORY26432.1 hypothetical protein BCR33DRAFT_859109 [Rhizoclosmatium globosum]